MKNIFLKTITNLKKSRDLKIIKQNFANQIISDQYLQCFELGCIKFLNCEFQNVDFTGSSFVDCHFENCIFKNITFRKCQYWNCTLKNIKISNSDLTRTEFDLSFFENSQFFKSNLSAADFSKCQFKETTFYHSNLDLILVFDVQFWKLKEWIDIRNSSHFEIIVKEMNEISLQIQEILKEDRTPFKNSMNFSELVDQLNWETKDQYFELIEGFLDESSNFLNFKKEYKSVVKVAKELESNSIFLEPSYQALGFSNFIHILIQHFDRYQMDTEISPKVFKSWVRKIFLEMKNHYS